jgi:hypothetical protein
MKRTLIVVLVSVNLALLVALVFGPASPRADAQVIGGGADYLMVTGQIGTNWDGVYIVDLDTRRMLSMRWDRTRKQMVPIRGRQLRTDFQAATPTP